LAAFHTKKWPGNGQTGFLLLSGFPFILVAKPQRRA
jgi:hypothetical protein